MTKDLKTICKISGITYVLAWILGLSFGGPNLALNASYSSVVQAYTAYKTGAIIAFAVAEGVTGLMLLTLVLASIYYLRQSTKNKSIWVFGTSGIIASLLSLVMSCIGLVLVLSTVSHGTVTQTGHLNDLINRLDGPKMWLLGLMAIGGTRAVTGLPRWIKAAGYALAASLLISGLSYGLLIQSLAWSVYIAGVLLLIWVCGFGLLIGKTRGVNSNA